MKGTITIEDAINITSGSRTYQKRLLIILVLGQNAVASFIMTTPFFLPSLSCGSSSDCIIDERLKNSASYELSITGEKDNQIAIFRTIYFTSIMLGSWVLTWIADKYGRKLVIKYSCIAGALFMTIGALSVNIYMLWVMAFGIGVLEIGFFIMGIVLLNEMVDYKYRNLYFGVYGSMWGGSATIFTLLYMFNLYWRFVLLLSMSFLLLQFFLMTYVHESPRFIITNLGDIEAATTVMKDISSINGAGDFPYTLETENPNIEKVSLSFRHLCISSSFCIRLTSMCCVWFNVVLGYYGMLFIMPSFIADVYLEGTALYIAESLAALIAMVLIDTAGRKKTMIGLFLLTGIGFFTIALLMEYVGDRNILEVYIIGFSMVTRLGLAGEFYLISIYTAELFPTRVRGVVFGLCNFVGRFSGIFASYLPLWCGVIGIPPAVVLGIAMAFSAAVATLLKETLGKKMLEVHEDEDSQPLLG